MKKIIVIGCPGSGKSTFSRKLRDKLDLPLFYLDMIWHKPDKSTIEVEEFDHKLLEILNKDKWIIDGNYERTLDLRLHNCDTVFYFDLPIKECINGVKQRIGLKREDLPWIEREFDEDFMKVIQNFPNIQRPKIYELLKKYDNKNIVVFKTRSKANEYINSL